MISLNNLAELPAPSRSARIVSILLATAFLTVGIREIVSPLGMDATYGVPLAGGDGLSFVSAVGARNIGLSLIGLFAALSGMRAALAAVFTAIAVVAALDFYIVSTAVGAANALKHAAFVLVMAGIAIWVARSGRQDPPNPPIQSRVSARQTTRD